MRIALSSTLLHFLWEGLLIAAIMAVVMRMARGSARARYAIALSSMLAMPVAFLSTFLLLMPQRQIVLPAVAKTASAVIQRSVDLPPVPLAQDGILQWAVPLWLTGVMICYLRSMAGWMAAQRMRRTGVCEPPSAWSSRVDRLRDALRISRPVVLLESALAEVPVVVGFLKPVILMPAGLLAGLPPAHVEAILIHELAHIRRWDYLANLAQSVVEGLLFYHPAVWWVGKMV